MIKGFAIVPPIIGRISIGKKVVKDGRTLPEKDDSFTLTTQHQNKEGWVLHPLHAQLSKEQSNGKIRSIPVRLLFNDSDLNLRAEFSAFDHKTGRPICVGNGETARCTIKSQAGVEEIACASPERCPLAREFMCKLYGRLNVQVEGQNDELGSFIFRTTGYNSVRTLAARLSYFQAVSGGAARYLPLQLRLRAKSTAQSFRTPVFYVDLTLRDGVSLAQAISQAKEDAAQDSFAGLDFVALEETARRLFKNGLFEETSEDVSNVLEEFYPEQSAEESEYVNEHTDNNRTQVAVSDNSATAPTNPLRTPSGYAVRPTRLSNKLGKSTDSQTGAQENVANILSPEASVAG